MPAKRPITLVADGHPTACDLPGQQVNNEADYRAVIALTVNFGLCYMGLLLVGLLTEPIKHSLQLSDLQLGVLTGVSFGIAFTALILPSARVADRWNRRHALFLCGLVFIAATLLTGLAGDFYLMLFARVLVAGCQAFQYSLSVSLIADALPPERRPLGFSIFTAGTWLALAIGFTLVGYAEKFLGWRGAFYLVTALYALLLPVVVFIVRDNRRTETVARPSLSLVFKKLIRKPTFTALVLIACLYGFAINTTANWTSAFLIRSHGFSQSGAANFMALSMGLFAGLVTLASGKVLLVARVRGPSGPLRVARNTTVVILALYLLGLSTTLSIAPTFLWIGLGIAGFINAVIMAATQELAEPLYRATAAALVVLPDCLLGNGAGPFVAGLLSDALTPSFGSNGLRISLLITTGAAWALAIPVYGYAIKWIERDAV
ncbi:MAG: MFS transporter [Steroidobacteraceae bacterium]|jgi:predicted MFS family arabinose efflux permease